MNDNIGFVSEQLRVYGITPEQWYYLSKFSVVMLEELAEVAKREYEIKEYRRLKEKYADIVDQ